MYLFKIHVFIEVNLIIYEILSADLQNIKDQLDSFKNECARLITHM